MEIEDILEEVKNTEIPDEQLEKLRNILESQKDLVTSNNLLGINYSL